MNPLSRQRKQVITILLLIIAGMSGKIFAQEKYPPEVLERIRLVENSLGEPIKMEGGKVMSLQERMKFYNLPAVSIAVINGTQRTEAKKL